MSNNLSNFGSLADVPDQQADSMLNVKSLRSLSKNGHDNRPNVKPLADLTDKEIIDGLKTSQEDVRLSQFQYEFYGRFAPYIFKVALHRCYIFNDQEDFAKEITQLTFIKALKAIGKFTVEAELPAKEYRHILKAWLGRIANNNFNKLYLDYRNQELEWGTLTDEEPQYDMFATLFDPAPEEQPSENLNLLREAMDKLKEIDKHIIITYASENCLNSTRHLSDNSMKILCDTYKTTSENIRQRKNRTLKKIKAYCLKIN